MLLFLDHTAFIMLKTFLSLVTLDIVLNFSVCHFRGGPDEHAVLLSKLQKSFKESRKVFIFVIYNTRFYLIELFPFINVSVRMLFKQNELNLLRDVAKMEAKLYKLNETKPEVFSLHRFVTSRVRYRTSPCACLFSFFCCPYINVCHFFVQTRRRQRVYESACERDQ